MLATIGVGVHAAAEAAPSAPASRYASIVLEAETGAVLYERNADLPRFPASLTKIMTLYMTFEALETKKLALKDEIVLSAYAVSRDPSRLNLAPGSRITVEAAIRAMTTKSANDAACALAEHFGGGSERRFAEQMTARAKKLGLKQTVFHNASGLPDEGHVSTARDLAVLSQALVRDFPAYYHYFSDGSFEFRGKRYQNQNRFLRTYYGADGIKTGFVNNSGHNLAASALRGGKRLIAIVLGGDTQAWTREHTTRLLDVSYAKIDPSLVMVASNASGAEGATPAASDAAASVPGTATVSIDVSLGVSVSAGSSAAAAAAPAAATAPPAPAVVYATPAGAVEVASAGPIPLPNGTAHLTAFAAEQKNAQGSAPPTARPAPAAKPATAPQPAVAAAQPAPKPVDPSLQPPQGAAQVANTASAAPQAGAPKPGPAAPQAVASEAAPAPAAAVSTPSAQPPATASAAPAKAAPPKPAEQPPVAAPKPVTAGSVAARATAAQPESTKPAAGAAGSSVAPGKPSAAAPATGAAEPAVKPVAPVAAKPAPAPTAGSPEAAAPAPQGETVTTNAGGGEWSVQVGLFRDATVARRRGEEARNRMPLQLRGADLVIGRAVDGVHVTSRISRLSEEDARAACNELQRGRVPCVVVPPGRPMVVATN